MAIAPEPPAATPPDAVVLNALVPEDTTEVYANFVQIFYSTWDFLFAFGANHLIPTEDGLGVTQLNRAEVLIRMSPQHAKSMFQALGGLLNLYEQTNGIIGLPLAPEGPQQNE